METTRNVLRQCIFQLLAREMDTRSRPEDRKKLHRCKNETKTNPTHKTTPVHRMIQKSSKREPPEQCLHPFFTRTKTHSSLPVLYRSVCLHQFPRQLTTAHERWPSNLVYRPGLLASSLRAPFEYFHRAPCFTLERAVSKS